MSSLVVDMTALATYDSEGVAPFINDFHIKKVTSTVSGNSLVFTDNIIGNTLNPPTIDGPYIADMLTIISSITVDTSNNRITYTLTNNDANGKSAYIWLRYYTN